MSVPPTSSTARASIAIGWMATSLFNIVLPILTYNVLTGHGVSEVSALLISGVWPVVELALTLIRERTVDEFSMIVLVFLAVGVISMLAFNSPRLILVKESAPLGLFGLVLLASLLAPRPLMFYFGRRFATGGDPQRIIWWNGLWRYPGFRHAQRILTATWGLALATTAAACIALIYTLPVATMVVVTNVVPYAVLGLLITGTMIYGKLSDRHRRQERLTEHVAGQT